MADNLTTADGVVATDEVGAAHIQRVKPVWGVDGSAVDTSATNPLPVVQTGTPGLPTGASTSAKQDTIIGHLDGVEGLLSTVATYQEAHDINLAAIATNTSAAIAGTEMQVDVVAALPAGTNNIGDVDVLTLPSLPAGNNNIGDVDIASALPAGTNAIGKLAANTGVDIGDVDVTSVVPGTAATNLGKAEDAVHASGDVGVMALAVRTDTPASSAANGDYEPPKTNSTGGVWVSEVANPAGGCSVFKSLDLDETEEDVKTSAGCVYGFAAFNLAASPRYLKFYNATAANVTVGTTTPVMTFVIPEAAASGAAGVVVPFPGPGVLFSTAISAAATTGLADNNTGAPGANEVVVNIFYA